MIVDLPATTTSALAKKLVTLRNEVGAMALGRVLTLIIIVDTGGVDAALETASLASRQHPCRIIAVVRGSRRGANTLDAQIRVGGDAGASEIVVLKLSGPVAHHAQNVVIPLLLADSPVVAWWPGTAPRDVHADPIGKMASRRITDSAGAPSARAALRQRAETYEPGDTDLAWPRITRWRAIIAATLDQAPFEPVTQVVVAGSADSPSTELLAGWLQLRLKCPATVVKTPPGSGIASVRLVRASGPIDLVRPGATVATLTQPHQPDRRIGLPRRSSAECLADELRRLDPDEAYAAVLLKGVAVLAPPKKSVTQAIELGESPSIAESRRLARKIARESTAGKAGAMVSPADEGTAPASPAPPATPKQPARTPDRKR